MASLQVQHSRRCPVVRGKSYTRTSLDGLAGCTCKPTFMTMTQVGGRKVLTPVGRNRREAEKALRVLEVDKDAGDVEAITSIPFDKWAETWYSSLARPKPNTIYSYRSTVDYAKAVFGKKAVRKIGHADIARFIAYLRDEGGKVGKDGKRKPLRSTTQAKHVRVLGQILRAAVKKGYAKKNPVAELDASERPSIPKTEAAYFLSSEVPRLLAEIPTGKYRTLFSILLRTGMRVGEAIALRWGDVDLTAAAIHVRRSMSSERYLADTKNRERRDVHIDDELAKVLSRWFTESGGHKDDAPVFPGTGKYGLLSASSVRNRTLYPAMERAGIPRECPEAPALRDVHSFRHTYAKTVLEAGLPIERLSRQLGHSSIKITMDTYGHFERESWGEYTERLASAFPKVFS